MLWIGGLRVELLIFSDSHGKGNRMQLAIDRQVTPIDAVVFLGDGLRDADHLWTNGATLFGVRGNCDWFSDVDAEVEMTIQMEGHRIFLTHGHAYGVKGGIGALIARAAELNADIVLFGHTHTPLCETIPKGTTVDGKPLARPMYLFNPGSIGEASASFGTLSMTQDVVLFSHGEI